MSDREPAIIKEFRELYDYVRLMGDHVNQIYRRLEQIESTLNEVSASHSASIRENALAITTIKENMVSKNEFHGFIEQLKASVSEQLPPMPLLGQKESTVESLSQSNDDG